MASDVVAVAAPSNPQSVSLPPDVAWIADAWAALSPHIREAILTLVDAGAADMPICDSSDGRRSRGTADEDTALEGSNNDARAWQLARKCRNIVQGCLREEEWQDADQEFFEIISEGSLGAAGI